MRIFYTGVALALCVVAATGSFLAVRSLRGDETSSASNNGLAAATASAAPGVVTPGPNAQEPPQEPLIEDRAKPRFEGEILGYFLADKGPPPAKFVTEEDICGPRESVTVRPVKWQDAGDFDLSLITLPDGWVLQDPNPNTGVWQCNDKIYIANRTYEKVMPNHWVATIIINKSLINWDTPDAPADRITQTTIGGRPVILVKPVSPDGLGSTSRVIVPGASPVLHISAINLPEVDLLQIAELVVGQ